MGWLSIFKPRAEGAAPAPAAPTSTDSVVRARTRARQRLVGAIVLVVIGVIGFPLVFETRPRPIPVDVAIEIPRKENATPLKVPAPLAPRPAASSPREEIVTESAADAGRDVPAPVAAPASTSKPSSAASAAVRVPPALATPSTPAGVPPAAVKPPPLADRPKAAGADGARAQSLLEGNGAAAKVGGRFVVQVGAFAEASAASEIRGKVERLGLKTYTQIAETPAGKRIRVRLGPYASRDEADRALDKARAAGLAGNVLAL